MAKSNAVWGIDIGLCAFKALRCMPHDDETKMEVVAFDYIEYPKILSQADVDPDELIADALTTFLSRNDVKGDKVAISVSGQSGLARFIKLPPVEQKKIPDIVKYEARQQIPFALEDVIWDYQEMGGSNEEEGFALETEVGLFAMKRDQVFESLKPFEDAGIDVDIIQLSPLALYNYIVFDQMRDLPPPEQYDPENPPESVIVISIGTDTTDLVVTNGFKVWQRSIPLGGNHFTKALTKQLKLTFAKAEHLKRNAEQAEDPRAVYQAMRPVFSDLVAEIMRSINFFYSLEKDAKITRAITLGNAMRLPGLESYLAKNLKDASKKAQIEVSHIDSFPGLVGPSVLTAPAFKENQLSFGTCYGLALQGIDGARLKTNLIPVELLSDRLIKAKKPWAVATVSVLLVGICANFIAAWLGLFSVDQEKYKKSFGGAERVSKLSKELTSGWESKKVNFESKVEIGETLEQMKERRLLEAQMIAALAQCLPTVSDPKKYDTPIGLRKEIYVMNFDVMWIEKLEDWHAGIKNTKEKDGFDENAAAPKGPGWIVNVTGYHYFNDIPGKLGAKFVIDTVMADLRGKSVDIPITGNLATQRAVTSDMGISHPVLVGKIESHNEVELTDPNNDDIKVEAKRFDFTLQFAWQPRTARERQDAKDEREKQEKADREKEAAEADDVATTD
jgi:type IV pilus assembly protein PilM